MSGSSDVLFVPDWRRGNPYQNLLAQAIESAGARVSFSDFPNTEFPLLGLLRSNPSVRVIHLHWINHYLRRIFWSGSTTKAHVRAFLLLLEIVIIRLRGIKVVWTVHNGVSHESPDVARELFARRCLARAVTKLVFHSASARKAIEELLSLRLAARSEVIPHGNYIGMYAANAAREEELKRRFSLGPDDIVILFFGGIRRYKGITQLLEAFSGTTDARLRLIIAGNPFEQQLAREIEVAAEQDKRIAAWLGFIPEEDVNPLYSISHLAAVPFERTLTSGSAILAMSMGKALLLPHTAKVIGLPDAAGTIFYEGVKELKDILTKLPMQDLEELGRRNRQWALELDWSRIGQQMVATYGFGSTK